MSSNDKKTALDWYGNFMLFTLFGGVGAALALTSTALVMKSAKEEECESAINALVEKIDDIEEMVYDHKN